MSDLGPEKREQVVQTEVAANATRTEGTLSVEIPNHKELGQHQLAIVGKSDFTKGALKITGMPIDGNQYASIRDDLDAVPLRGLPGVLLQFRGFYQAIRIEQVELIGGENSFQAVLSSMGRVLYGSGNVEESPLTHRLVTDMPPGEKGEAVHLPEHHHLPEHQVTFTLTKKAKRGVVRLRGKPRGSDRFVKISDETEAISLKQRTGAVVTFNGLFSGFEVVQTTPVSDGLALTAYLTSAGMVLMRPEVMAADKSSSTQEAHEGMVPAEVAARVMLHA